MNTLPIPPGMPACLPDYEAAARARLPTDSWQHFMGVAGAGVTARENQSAFDRLHLRGRVLAAPDANSHTRIRLLGRTLPHPILLAPVAFQHLAHPEGEKAAALGAAACGALYVASMQSSQTLETIAAAAPGAPRWFQLYWHNDLDLVRSLLRRAEHAGYEAIVFTADAPVSMSATHAPRGLVSANLVDWPRLAPPPAQGLCGGLAAAAPSWQALAWLCRSTRLPVVVKGVLDPEDARLAADTGAAAVIVSNHGGRTLDGLPATIEALPGVVAALAGRIPALLDGGIRRGADIVRALALGADAILIGRPWVHGLAVGGATGVAHVVNLLRAELEIAMTLTGCAEPRAIARRVLWDPPASPVSHPTATP